MFLKLQTHVGSNEYFIIANLEEVRFTKSPQFVGSENEAQEFVGQSAADCYHIAVHPLVIHSLVKAVPRELSDAIIVVEENIAQGQLDLSNACLHVNALDAHDSANERRIRVIFDGEGFLCNDDGKTVHRFPDALRNLPVV